MTDENERKPDAQEAWVNILYDQWYTIFDSVGFVDNIMV
ncbi:hypothetical protein A464_3189 [Salmonella bongori N268-08]|uniref:Uncharacterized protein n=1 Tax=Salmonella bongori N268-08 TaxID=1197719 RepID=S5N081_SALBN|nr:hypothetical protein A464_3189 [Salmonella bongori N268-08]